MTALFGALAVIGLVLVPAAPKAESAAPLTLTVEDTSGVAQASATIANSAGKPLGRTDEAGNLTVTCSAPCRLTVSSPGFAAQTVSLSASAAIHLQPAAAQQVTVTAYRAPLGELQSPVATRVLSQNAMRTTAAITLDSQLAQIPGVQLYRRSSSLVSNPTSLT